MTAAAVSFLETLVPPDITDLIEREAFLDGMLCATVLYRYGAEVEIDASYRVETPAVQSCYLRGRVVGSRLASGTLGDTVSRAQLASELGELHRRHKGYEPCCAKEKRDMRGGCVNCGDPSF